MTKADLKPGAVIRYPYLWSWQKDRAEAEGRKERPVCVLIAVTASDGLTHLALLAISSRPASADQIALEVPETERRRVGLGAQTKAWVTVSEYNYDVAEHSFYLDRNQSVMGHFSRPFMRQLAMAAAPLFQRSQRRIDRTD